MRDVSGLDVLWDANDVARYLGVSRATVYRKVETGKLPHLRVFGTVLRFDPEAIRKIGTPHNEDK